MLISSGGANQWKEEKAVGAVEKQTTHNNKPFSKHLPVFPPFSFQNVLEIEYWRGDGNRPSAKPIDNEWPIKPPLPTSRASNHSQQWAHITNRDLRSI
jgi:hypothetical protein